MEITGSFSPLALYPGTGQAPAQTQANPPPEKQSQPTTTSIQPTINRPQNEAEPRRQRFYIPEKDLSHSARQALHSYADSTFAGGPELMNRIDVYA